MSRLRVRSAKAALAAGEADLALVLSARATVREGRLELTHFPPARYYALAWSLVHFLATDPGTRVGFRRFELRLLAAPPDGLPEARARRLLAEECGDPAELEPRWRAHLAALPEPEPPAAPPVYAWELESPRAYVRYAALRRLAAVPADLRPGVLACLRDRDVVVRAAACEAMARAMGADAVDDLVAALDLGDEPLRKAALAALDHPSAGGAVPRLLAMLDEERGGAVGARGAGARDGPRPGPAGGADTDAALRALATIADPRAFPALREALADPFLAPATRARCASTLAADPEAVDALARTARDPDPVVRAAALVSLRRLEGDLAAVAAAAAEDPATAAAGATAAPGDPAAAPGPPPGDDALQPARRELLLELLATPGPGVDATVEACGELARAGALEAVPALRRLCRPTNPEPVRLAAILALARLTGETRGFAPAQPARAREAAYRAWYEDAG